MDEADFAVLGQQIDKSQVPPIHQKRILAFVNHFVVSTVTFLNKFVIKCESKFIEFENKLQRVEASLEIVESKLASIPGAQEAGRVVVQRENEAKAPEKVPEEEVKVDLTESPQTAESEPEKADDGVKACEDVRYRKYFKMVQFGVPPPAVKQKMGAEGLNPDILDEPSKILPDGIQYHEPVESDDD
ncbi:WASH complex subunit 3 [Phlebotomus argentipes]|uniref:WASH complex subunit 3 n=1 Tax=Phlebotomus argentipes TaxID=94469 RepID=UPI00289364DA|nr:WASH complex subunit 3 [Phlebotomus argentipes]